jgi:ubiquinone/menaquinone biosynthesis C-methylase UbiE
MLTKGRLIVSDPSNEQLNVIRKLNKRNIEYVEEGVDSLTLTPDTTDAIWSFRAFYHCHDKIKSFGSFALSIM